MKSIILSILCSVAMIVAATSCISDEVGSSPAQQPQFSADTLALGTVWAGELTPTAAVRVYNRHSKAMVISDIRLTGQDAACMLLNVDGTSCTSASAVEIRANDSIFILAAATPAAAGELRASIEFTTNGVSTSLPVSAQVIDAQRLENRVVDADLTLSGDVRVFGTLTVAPSARLTVSPGTRLWLHDAAAIKVQGSLDVQGTPRQPVLFGGDRTGFVAADIPYSIMSGQWQGIAFEAGSQSNSIACARIDNTCSGITLGDNAQLSLLNTIVFNSKENIISLSSGASLTAAGCALTDAPGAMLSVASGASASLLRCTLASNYLFAAPTSAAVALEQGASLSAAGCIIYRPGAEVSPVDISSLDVTFTRCIFGSKGSDDSSFIDCLWAVNPMFLVDTESYTFDYRLAPASPARGAAAGVSSPQVDFYGVAAENPPAAGAFN